ncbi:type II toxin-antitoxin system death-on-curing family toxin [Paremcibacter congregatus]|uniref:Fido domain-containing protein n=1 Tax=Paremcibacter congregatus TaxID=2043170 RepID=A0A2G4YTL3_9PROT|nr:type II toxin-antitoxin system death-on-curing family toxin [Paremcibacter congregatus]PHZ85679.1 hypothetical protein CRD36_03045 [Paremcibacter congregatus]QDE26639.1 type II toxin-antitoxin system death-on-curing family toxin [Paremcibacter congregatus]
MAVGEWIIVNIIQNIELCKFSWKCMIEEVDFELIENEEVKNEYERCKKGIGEEDKYKDAKRLGIHDVVKAHFLIADYFYSAGEGMGGIGPRDTDLLNSALYRQHVSLAGILKYNDSLTICSTLFYGLVKDHVFYDGNKRTAFTCLVYHLMLHGLYPTLSQKELEDFTVDVADGEFKKKKRYIDYSKNSDDPDIKYIAHFLKKNTRKKDTKSYSVTYRQLNKILMKFGYELENAGGNYIDIRRKEIRRKAFKAFGIEIKQGKEESVNIKVCQIGFPGWTKKVNDSAINTVRKATKLDHKHGIDSAAFFKNQDPIRCMILDYAEPLHRLAYR